VHPRTGKEMFFSSEVPADMTQMIERWRTLDAATLR
jgi:23S rRNA pseudouridine1911/1915/1917 synthase